MLNRETILTLFEDAARGLVWNLDFVPEDKFAWKPAPDAKSSLEIVNHLTDFLDSVSHRLGANETTFVPATNRDEAKALMTQSAARFTTAVRAATPELLGEQFSDEMPLSNGWIVTAALMDIIHHNGQIAYIQTLLGDNEMHFDENAMPDWAVN